jgi:pyridoxamine 5'-phosphate oxidase
MPAMTPLADPTDPLLTLKAWRDEAAAAGQIEPDAMALGTASPAGQPSVRMVLWRGLADGALHFFTNYESRKAGDLDANPRAAVCFHFAALGRQVRVEGPVRRLPAAASDAYWATRPRGHQISSSSSPQSRPVASLDELRARQDALAAEYEGRPVPRPAHWGGYALQAERVELWIQGADRCHDRRLFIRVGDTWREERLGP